MLNLRWKTLLLAVTLGYSSFQTALHAAPRGGILRVVSIGEPEVLNPVFDRSPAAQELYNLIYSGLIRENSLTGLEPDLVEVVPTPTNGQVKILPSGAMEVHYRLRQGLKWQDGQALTSDDILFTWQVHTDPAITSPPTPGYEHIKSIEIINPQTAIVTFHQAYGEYYRLFQHLLPRHSFRSAHWKFAANHPYNRHPVGSGPFVLKEWVKGKSATLEANPLYYRARPALDQLRYRFEPSGYSTMKEALNWVKDAEWMRGLSLASYEYLKNQPQVDLHVVPTGEIETLMFNVSDPVLADRRVRRALAFATDRQAIGKMLLGITEPAYSDQLRDSWKYNPAAERFYAPNTVQARNNLEQAGWKNKALELELSVAQGNKSHEIVSRYLQESWKALGVTLKIKTMSPENLQQNLSQGQYQLSFATLGQQAGENPFKRWHSTQRPPQGFNYSGFSDYQMDALTRELQQSVNFSRQKSLYREIGQILAEEIPSLPLYYGATLQSQRETLHNFAPNATLGSTWNSHSWWIE